MRLAHPLELLAIAAGSIIGACVLVLAFGFIAGTIAGIIVF